MSGQRRDCAKNYRLILHEWKKNWRSTARKPDRAILRVFSGGFANKEERRFSHRLSVDPSLKTWKKELVCDRCRRWASALTLIRPGESWNGIEPSPELVGKKICYVCIVRIFRLGPPVSEFSPESSQLIVAELILLLSTAIVFLAALLFRIDPTAPGLVFVGSLGFLAFERWLREEIYERNRSRPRRAGEGRLSRERHEPLVSVETLFKDQTMA